MDVEPVLVSELQAFYNRTDPMYRTLVKRYDQEKADAQRADFPSLEQWIPEEGQPLAESQLTMSRFHFLQHIMRKAAKDAKVYGGVDLQQTEQCS